MSDIKSILFDGSVEFKNRIIKYKKRYIKLRSELTYQSRARTRIGMLIAVTISRTVARSDLNSAFGSEDLYDDYD